MGMFDLDFFMVAVVVVVVVLLLFMVLCHIVSARAWFDCFTACNQQTYYYSEWNGAHDWVIIVDYHRLHTYPCKHSMPFFIYSIEHAIKSILSIRSATLWINNKLFKNAS